MNPISNMSDKITQSERMKVVLPVQSIPLDSIVTKLTGTKKYRLTDVIKIYAESTGLKHPDIKSEGVFYLFPIEPDYSTGVCAITGEKEMLWHTNADELYRYLNKQYMRDNN